MSFKNILIMAIVIVLFGATFGAMVGTVHGSSPSALPMPYGTRDLTHQNYLNRFIGVRTTNNVWYTFVADNTKSETSYYLNAGYADSSVYNGKSDTPEGRAYYYFLSAKVDHPVKIENTNGQTKNEKDGVTGVVGVKITSYGLGDALNHPDVPTLYFSVVSLFKDNYVENPSGSPLSTSYIEKNKGLVPSYYSNPYTRNFYYKSEIVIEKSGGAGDTSISFSGPGGEGVDEGGVNAHPGTKIKYTEQGNVDKKIAEKLILYAIREGTDAASDDLAEIGWMSLDVIETAMQTGNVGENPWQPSPFKYLTPGYLRWAAKLPDREHYVVESTTMNDFKWHIPPSQNIESEPIFLKIYAKFWYYEPTDRYGDMEYKSFQTNPIYIYAIPKRIGVGIPTPPVPSGYNGAGISYSKIWTGSKYETLPVYNSVPTTFNAVINKKFTIKTADVAYGWDANKSGMLPATIEYKIDWGDGTTSTVNSNTPNNGKEITASHIYKHLGYYTVRVCAKSKIYDGLWHPYADSWNGGWGPWSRGTVIHVVDAFRTGPKAPYAGSTTFYTDSSGKAKITFKTSASTYAGSQIKYVFYW
ncbi:MAG: hypothetical protein GXO25_06435, partial [Euryarchaeota archaeon]|nr:hypothetical protein [Euryarchaeota archaeon]